MNIYFKITTAALALTLLSACTTYTGDSLLKLSDRPNAHSQKRIVAKAKSGMSDILDSFQAPEKKKIYLKNFSPAEVIRSNKPMKLMYIDGKMVIAGKKTTIGFAFNSIIISSGDLDIAHSSNNFVVCGGNLDISHDGGSGDGSLIVSKGKVSISHGRNSFIYAVKGVAMANARNVKAFNTKERKTSWGRIKNTPVKPLFRDETLTDNDRPLQ